MTHPAFLNRMRLSLPTFNFAIFCVWLFLSINIVPGRATGCSGCGSPSSKCDNHPCGDNQRKVKYSFDPSTLPAPPDGSTWTWKWSIAGSGVNEGGTISSTGTEDPGTPTVSGTDSGTFCAPVDKTMTVTISPGENQTPASSSSQEDPTMTAEPWLDIYGGFANPLPTVPQGPQNPPYLSGSLLTLTWCGGCSESESSQQFSEGSKPFSIPKESGNSTLGGASGSLESVHFRINLGRRNGKTTELVIGKDHIADCLNPAAVEFPSIGNRYLLEIWRWNAYYRNSNAAAPLGSSPIGDTGASIESTGSLTVIPFFGRDGYSAAFAALGVTPRGRGANNFGFSPKPVGSLGYGMGGEVNVSDSGKRFYLQKESPSSVGRFSTPLADCVSPQNWNSPSAGNTGPGVNIQIQEGGIPVPPGPIDPGAPLQSDGSLDDYVRGYLKRTESDMVTFAFPDNDVPEGGVWSFWHRGDLPYSMSYGPGSPPSVLLWGSTGVGAGNSAFVYTQHDPTDVTASYNVRAAINSPDSTNSPGENDKDGAVGPDVVIEIHDLRGRPTGSLDYEIRAYLRRDITFYGDAYDSSALPPPFAIWTVRAESGLASGTVGLRINEYRGTGLSNNPSVALPANPVRWFRWTETIGSGGASVWQYNEAIDDLQTIEVLNKPGVGGKTNITEKRDMTGVASGNQPVGLGSTTGAVLSRHHEVFDSNGKITSSTEGVGADAIVTTFDYTSDVLTSIRRTDGYFEIYRHTVDANNPGDVSDDEERDVTIRPWKNQAFNSSLTEDQGATTIVFSRPAQGDWSRTIEKINGNVTSDSTSVSVDASVSYLSERPENQPIRRTTTTRTVGSKTKVSITERYRSGASPSLAGRLAKRVGEDGKTTIFHHYNYVDGTTGAQYLQSGGWITFEINAGAAYSTESYQTVYDSKGREVYRETYLTSESEKLLLLSKSESVYSSNGALSRKLNNGNDAYWAQFVWNAIGTEELKVSETDAIGGVTNFSDFNTSGLPQTVTKPGFLVDGSLTAIPEQVIRYRYDGLGRVRREVRGNFVRETNYDSRGRLLTEIEGNGTETGALTNTRVTSHAYTYPAGGGSQENVTHPGGGTVISSTFADGQDAGTSGTAAVSRSIETLHFGNTWSPTEPAGLKTPDSIMEKSYRGGELESVTIRNGLGEITAEYILSFDAAQNLTGSWRTFIYNDAGEMISESIAGSVVRTIVPTPTGSVETLFCSPNPDQTRINHSYYELAEPPNHEAVRAWWRISTENGTITREMLTWLSEIGNGAIAYAEITDSTGAKTTTRTLGNGGVLRQETEFSGVASKSIIVSRGGLIQSSASPAGGTTYYSYDALGRQIGVKSPALGAQGGIVTSITYDPIFGQQDTVTTTSELATDGASTTTATVYYPPASEWPGRILSTTTDSRVTNQSYTAQGELHRVWGATYPQQYTYDNTGRLWKLHTYRATPSGNSWPAGDVTTWEYKYGLLWKKTDAANHTVTYYYDGRGRMNLRYNARGTETEYEYDNADQNTYRATSDFATPNIHVTYDALGRVQTVNESSSGSLITALNRTFTYDGSSGRVTAESTFRPNATDFDRIPTSESSVNRTYVNGRLDETTAWAHGARLGTYASLWKKHTYKPDSGLLQEVQSRNDWTQSSGNAESLATYGYRTGTAFNDGLSRTLVNGTASAVHTGKTPDGIGRLKAVETKIGGSGGTTHYAMSYGYNVKGLRETASTTLGDWQYFYNDRGELTGGVKTKNGVVVPGYQFGYVFDAIGNRTTAEVTTNGHTATSTLTPNALNQITARTVPGELQVRGHVSGNATTAQVGLKNGTTTDWYSALPIVSGNFAAAVPVNNSAGIAAARLDIRATTSNPEKEVKSLHRAVLPPQNETLTYDDDGNIASDGLWTYTWDVENRLIKMQAKPGAAPWSAEGNLPASAASLEFAYDWMGRRIHSRVKDLAGHIIRVTDFVWDGWNIVAEVDATPRVFLYYQGQQYYFPQGWATSYRTYVWGADVSGSPAGAGGVGGLLAVHLQYMDAAPVPVDPMYGGQYLQGDDPWSVSVLRTDYPVYDGNGNIMSYLNAATGAVEQEEEYGPFGENLRPRSTNILRCPIGWSTKYTDEETGLVAYQLRYYNPTMGRWMSSDPNGEDVDPEAITRETLYGFILNRPQCCWDYLGLSWGHHIIPQSIFNKKVSAAVQEFFHSDVARIFNDAYKTHGYKTYNKITHAAYNEIIEKELENFLGKTKLRDMTLRQAEQFLKEIKSKSKKTAIGRFNAGVAAEAAAAKAAQTITRQLEEAARKAGKSSEETLVRRGARLVTKTGSTITKRLGPISVVIFGFVGVRSAGAGNYAFDEATDYGMAAMPLGPLARPFLEPHIQGLKTKLNQQHPRAMGLGVCESSDETIVTEKTWVTPNLFVPALGY